MEEGVQIDQKVKRSTETLEVQHKWETQQSRSLRYHCSFRLRTPLGHSEKHFLLVEVQGRRGVVQQCVALHSLPL